MQSSLASLFPKALHFAETFFSFSSESEIFGKRLRNSSPRCVLCSISLNYLLSIFGLTILNAQSNNTVLMKYDNIYIFCVLCVYAFLWLYIILSFLVASSLALILLLTACSHSFSVVSVFIVFWPWICFCFVYSLHHIGSISFVI